MMTPESALNAGVVGILNPQGRMVGTGFVVAPDLILTCAHVVEQAQSGPGRTLALRYHATRTVATAQVSAEMWRAPAEGDIAVLRLEAVLPHGVAPLSIALSADNLADRAFRALGYPALGDMAGVFASGVIEGLAPNLGGRSFLQLTSPNLAQGMSGAPVLDVASGMIVGMVTAVFNPDLTTKHRDTAYATPVDLLRAACPSLPAPTQAGTWDQPFGDRGRIEDPGRYFVRQPLTREIFDELHKGQSISIVGDSQTGKSSLLWHITQTGPGKLGRSAEDFAYFDLQLVGTEAEFFEGLCEELHVPTNHGLKLARALRGRKVVLCLDEIEKMAWQGFSVEVRSELRGLADGGGAPLTLAIASRSPLSRLFPDSPELTSPLAGLCLTVEVPAFTWDEVKAFARDRLAGSGLAITDADLEAAWKRSQGHAARLQHALRDIVHRSQRHA